MTSPHAPEALVRSTHPPHLGQDGPVVRTLHDVRVFILDQSGGTQEHQSWQKAFELLLAAAEHRGVVEAVTRQVESALFLEARLLLQAARSAGRR